VHLIPNKYRTSNNVYTKDKKRMNEENGNIDKYLAVAAMYIQRRENPSENPTRR
jgi:hypothetical protein